MTLSLKTVCLPVLLVFCSILSLFVTLALAGHSELFSSVQLELSITLTACLCFSLLVACGLAVSPTVQGKAIKSRDVDEVQLLRQQYDKLQQELVKANKRREEETASLEASLCSAVENAVSSRAENTMQGVSECYAEARQALAGQNALEELVHEVCKCTAELADCTAVTEASEQKHQRLVYDKVDDEDQANINIRLKALAAEQWVAEKRLEAQIQGLHHEHGALQKNIETTCDRLNEMTEDAANRTKEAQDLMCSKFVVQQEVERERLEARLRKVWENQVYLGARTEDVFKRVHELNGQAQQQAATMMPGLVLAAEHQQTQLTQAEGVYSGLLNGDRSSRWPIKKFETQYQQSTTDQYQYTPKRRPLSPKRPRSPTGGRLKPSSSRVIPQSAWAATDNIRWGS